MNDNKTAVEVLIDPDSGTEYWIFLDYEMVAEHNGNGSYINIRAITKEEIKHLRQYCLSPEDL